MAFLAHLAIFLLAAPVASHVSYTMTRASFKCPLNEPACNAAEVQQSCTQVQGGVPCKAPKAGEWSEALFNFDHKANTINMTSLHNFGTYVQLMANVMGTLKSHLNVTRGGPFFEEELTIKGTTICHNSVQCCTNATANANGDLCCDLPGNQMAAATVCHTSSGTSKYGNGQFKFDAPALGSYTISSVYGRAYVLATQTEWYDERISIVQNWGDVMV